MYDVSTGMSLKRPVGGSPRRGCPGSGTSCRGETAERGDATHEYDVSHVSGRHTIMRGGAYCLLASPSSTEHWLVPRMAVGQLRPRDRWYGPLWTV